MPSPVRGAVRAVTGSIDSAIDGGKGLIDAAVSKFKGSRASTPKQVKTDADIIKALKQTENLKFKKVKLPNGRTRLVPIGQKKSKKKRIAETERVRKMMDNYNLNW